MDTSLKPDTIPVVCISGDWLYKQSYILYNFYLVLVGSSYNERESQRYHKTYVPAVHITREKVCK